MTKNPHKLAERLLNSKSSIGDPDDDLKTAFDVLMAVADARSGGKVNSTRVILRSLLEHERPETLTDMVRKIGTADQGRSA